MKPRTTSVVAGMKAALSALLGITVGLGAMTCTASPGPNEATVAKAEVETKLEALPAKAEPEPKQEAKIEPKQEAKAEAKLETPPAEPKPPLAPPPKGLVSGPLPDPKDGKTPAVVFAAGGGGGEWQVDMTDFSGMKMKKLERKLAAQMEAEWAGEEGGEEGDDAPKPSLLETKAGKALIPAGFAVGDAWTLVTASGAEHRTTTGFDAIIMGGSGELHFYVKLGKSPEGTERPAIAFRGHLPTTTRLEVPKVQTPSVVGPDVLASVVSAIRAALEPDMRDILDKDPVEQAEVALHAGHFPGKRTHVAFVKSGKEDSEIPPIEALTFIGEGGKVEVVVPADPSLFGYVTLLGLLDVDGDGFDEVFFEDGYHEGWYVTMLQWAGEAPVLRQLTGDGI